MGDTFDEAVVAWREGSTESSRRSGVGLARVLEEARSLALRAARALNLSDEDAEDVAQDACVKLADKLQGGDVLERPGAWVWSITQNRARDLHRKRGTRTRTADALKHDAAVGGERKADAESAWMSREDRDEAKALVAEVLDAAIDSHRRALRAYLDHESIESLAESYASEALEAHAAAGEALDEDGEKALRKRARNRADQHLKRGRDWAKKYIAEKRSR